MASEGIDKVTENDTEHKEDRMSSVQSGVEAVHLGDALTPTTVHFED